MSSLTDIPAESTMTWGEIANILWAGGHKDAYYNLRRYCDDEGALIRQAIAREIRISELQAKLDALTK